MNKARSLTNHNIITLWVLATNVHDLATKHLNNHTLIKCRLMVKWLARLSSISWFIPCLNEGIPLKANHEDGLQVLSGRTI